MKGYDIKKIKTKKGILIYFFREKEVLQLIFNTLKTKYFKYEKNYRLGYYPFFDKECFFKTEKEAKEAIKEVKKNFKKLLKYAKEELDKYEEAVIIEEEYRDNFYRTIPL